MNIIKINIFGKNIIHKRSMIELFENSKFKREFKISEVDADLNLSIEDKGITLSLCINLKRIHLNNPISVNDLLGSIRNILSYKDSKDILNIKNITIDVKTSSAHIADKKVELTEKELQIIICLYNADNNVLTKEDLLSSVWGYSKKIDTHTLESHIYTLRQKIEEDSTNPQIIVTNKGSYKLIL